MKGTVTINLEDYEKINNFVINILPVKTNEKSDIHSITRSYTRLLEDIIIKFPEQYFWFHRRWKTKPF